MNEAGLVQRLAAALGRSVVGSRPLGGGCVADVREVELDNGTRCVVKVAPERVLETEAWMLRYLAAHSRLPVPAVLHADGTMLVLEFVVSDEGGIESGVERDAADHLATLHAVTSPCFGLERDTVIGGLPQPNAWADDWREFFRDRRLLFMGRRALDAGAISSSCFGRLERLSERLDEWIPVANRASLIHGDVWGGNVLVRRGRVAAFLDPAIYFADAEVELAFVTLFGTFGETFFRCYGEHRDLATGFFEVRRHVYNLYPLLVHAVLFGGGYGDSVDRTLRRFIG